MKPTKPKLSSPSVVACAVSLAFACLAAPAPALADVDVQGRITDNRGNLLQGAEVIIPELKLRRARRETLEHVVVADTRTPARLGEVCDLIQRDRCPITLIDHHVTEEDQLGAGEVVSRPVGATCTLIASLFVERSLEPTREEASLLLMGIYEDTGGLAYGDTTPEDLRAVAWLLERGGTLSWKPP